MLTRLIAFAASLAIVTGASFAMASTLPSAAPSGAKAMRVIQLEPVVVTAKRLPR